MHRFPVVARLTSIAVLAGLVVFWLITTFPVKVEANLARIELVQSTRASAQAGEPRADGGKTVRSYDFVHYFRAAEASRKGENIYESWNGGYVYPPLLAWMLEPLVPLGLGIASTLWYGVIFACVVLTGTHTIGVVNTSWKLRSSPISVLAPLAIAAIVFNDQVKGTLYLGQTDSILALCFALGLMIASPGASGAGGGGLRPRAALAGLGVAIATHVKFLALGLLPYYVLTRRWAVLAWSGLFLLVLGLIPGLTHSWNSNLSDLHIAFARVLGVVGIPAPSFGRFDPHPIEWARSRSIVSALARVGVELGDPKLVTIAGGVVVAAAWALGAGLIYRRHGLSLIGRVLRPSALPLGITPMVLALEWCTLVAGLLALGPQTTKRHALILLPVVILAASISVNGRVASARRCCAMGLVLVFVANLVPISSSFRLASLSDAWRTLGTLGALGWAIAIFSLLVLDAGLSEARAAANDAALEPSRGS